MENLNFRPAFSSINPEELELFRKYLCDKSGICIPPEKAYMFETRLSKMIVDVGVDSFRELYDYIISGKDLLAEQNIINAMTVNETFWFRDAYLWKALEEMLLPRLIGQLRDGTRKKLRIWCAAVSTGQEAYSAVMCVDNYLNKNKISDITLADFDFFATDISSRVLNIAKKGRYDQISIMRGLDDYYRDKYFVNEQNGWDLKPEIRDAVTFRHFNLLNSYFGFGSFDVIFCRYVLIYFSEQIKKEIVGRMHESLNDKGILFTGSAAFYELFADRYQVEHYDNLTYYTKSERR